jgi:autophagy-related protein 2
VEFGLRLRNEDAAKHNVAEADVKFEALPTTQDVAAAFLAVEPAEERQELEAAIQSQSVANLGDESLSESSFEGEPAAGLPTFLAGFLKGITDRLEVTIQDVSLDVTFDTPSGSPGAATESKVRIQLRELDVEGFTSVPPIVSRDDSKERGDMRHLIFRDISVRLTSCRETIAKLQRVSSSPSQPRSSPALSRSATSQREASPKSLSTSQISTRIADAEDPESRPESPEESKLVDSIAPDERFADASDDEEDGFGQLDGSTEPFPMDMDVSGLQVSNLMSSQELGDPDGSASVDNARYPHDFTRQIETSKDGGRYADSDVDSADGEDLAESKYFTHEEAQSMYQSAMSELARSRKSSDSEGERALEAPFQDLAASQTRDLGLGDISDDPDCATPRILERDPESPAEESHVREGNVETVTTELLSFESISILVPWSGAGKPQQTREDRPSSPVAESVQFENMPGGFSYHESASRPRQPTPESRPKSEKTAPVDAQPERPDIELKLGVAHGKIDIASGRILFDLVQRIISSAGAVKAATTISTSDPAKLRVKISSESTKMSIYEQLAPLDPESREQEDPLLHLDLRAIGASLELEGSLVAADVDIGKLALGFTDYDMLHFDSSAEERVDQDISIRYRVSAKRGQEVHLSMRQMLLDLDMQKIDDRLESYGGLSAVLDLSSSIASNSTILGAAAKSPRPDRTLAGKPDASPGPKINARIQGIKVRVDGKTSGVGLQTGPLSAIVRDAGVSVKTPVIQLRGPLSKTSSNVIPIDVEVQQIAVSFLLAPSETDLTELVSLIMPSRDRYVDDDDILLDTLLRQRKKGAVIRGAVGDINVQVADLKAIPVLQSLGADLSKLQNVTKYFPEDDRPGILSLISINMISSAVHIDRSVGAIKASLEDITIAHVGLPALFAAKVGTLDVSREDEALMHSLLRLRDEDNLPMLMAKMVGDELEPTLKVKIFNVAVEYRVSTLMLFLGLAEKNTREDLAASLASSVATVRGAMPRPSSEAEESKPTQLCLQIRDCAGCLNPARQTSCAVLLIGDGQLRGKLASNGPLMGELELQKCFLLAIDDVARIDTSHEPTPRPKSLLSANAATIDFSKQGYKALATLSSAKVSICSDKCETGDAVLVVNVSIKLLVLETCADSTQTLIQLVDGLAPPPAPSVDPRYHTEPMDPEDLMSEFSGEEYDQSSRGEADKILDLSNEAQISDLSEEFEMIGSFYDPRNPDGAAAEDDSEVEDSRYDDGPPRAPFSAPQFVVFRHNRSGTPMKRIDNHLLAMQNRKMIKSWVSSPNGNGAVPEVPQDECPFRLEIQCGTFMWNLFDGYDWPRTRDAINTAVDKVQSLAEKRRMERNRRADADDDESEIGDFLFQSIWIAVPPNRDEHELRRRINRQMDEDVSETATVTTTASHSTARPDLRRRKSRSLRLDRSKRHKVSIEISNLKASVTVTPPGALETQSVVVANVGDLEIFDHIPTSTWKKFVTYLKDSGIRPMDKPLIRLELLTVKPKPELAATELVIKVDVMPLRLHVDQDTLDFIVRFFAFKDAHAAPPPRPAQPSEPPFIQRCEVRAVPLLLDYKPKKIDYVGLRSGKTKELMNIIALDESKIMLKRLIVFGISGFDNLQDTLHDLWVGDVIRNQLPVVLQGLGPLRPLAKVGGGVRQLIVVPMTEYQKDGRILRSIRKGASVFTRTTTSEIARLAARVAMGAGTVLEGAEGLLSPAGPASPSSPRPPYDDADDSDDGPGPGASAAAQARHRARGGAGNAAPAVSHYAQQPLTVAAGLRSAARLLERDLASARDAIIAVGADVRESETAADVARAVARGAPAVVLKPAIGATRALGTALLGAGNALDKESRRKVEDVSLSLFCCWRVLMEV